MRESGYYWVKVSDVSDWEPAEYSSDSDLWTLMGEDQYGYDKLAVIGPRIVPPNDETDARAIT